MSTNRGEPQKGAFTGAHTDKPGLVEAAAGGTLFLDELGDVPQQLQVKLLRLLESGTYRRVGETAVRRANFRLISATHQDLPTMVATQQFRRDLYYRVSAFPITMPPLRDRRKDIPLLSKRILIGLQATQHMSSGALHLLQHHPFPGNIRELRNMLERAVLLADGDALLPEHFPEAHQAPVPCPPALYSSQPPTPSAPPGPDASQVISLQNAEAHYLRWALTQIPTDRSRLAQRLGISERTLFRKLKSLPKGPFS